MSKKQQLEVTHKALSDQNNDLLKEEEPKYENKADEDDDTSEKPINLKSKAEVNKSQWPQDMETVEINTEGWENRPG